MQITLTLGTLLLVLSEGHAQRFGDCTSMQRDTKKYSHTTSQPFEYLYLYFLILKIADNIGALRIPTTIFPVSYYENINLTDRAKFFGVHFAQFFCDREVSKNQNLKLIGFIISLV